MVKASDGYLDYDFCKKGIEISIKNKGYLHYGCWTIKYGWREGANKERDDLISHLMKWKELLGADRVNMGLGDLRFPYPDSITQSGFYGTEGDEDGRDKALRSLRNKDY